MPLLYELVKKMFSVASSIVLKSVNNDKAYFSKIEGFRNGFEAEELFKVVYSINAVNKTGKIYVYFKIYSMMGTRVDTLKQKPGFMTFLRDNNLFMNMHQYETYAISTVGHVFKRLPEATNCQDYKEMLEAKIVLAQEAKAEKNPTSRLLVTPMIKIEVQPTRVIHLLCNQQGQVTEKGDTYALRASLGVVTTMKRSWIRMVEADDWTPEAYDQYLTALVLLPRGDSQERAIVKRRTKDDDGNPVGKRDANPILDTREYEVEFPDGSIDVYTANTLAEAMYSQVDDEGRHVLMLKEIVDHSKDRSAVHIDDNNNEFNLLLQSYLICAFNGQNH
jgi:hypothetical protein